MRRATADSQSWEYLNEFEPDLALLQEVGSIPDSVGSSYSTLYRMARGKTGQSQKFGTVILVRGSVDKPIELTSDWDWVNQQLVNFRGNLVAAQVSCNSIQGINVVSVYSPAWPIGRSSYEGVDVSPIKLEYSPDVWVTELLWAALKTQDFNKGLWIVAGDLNTSATFDDLWPGGPHGNREVLQRFKDIGLIECLQGSNGMLIPTFRNSRGGKIIHQMDHIFVSNKLFALMKSCEVGSEERVFGESLSDHLPIVTNFDQLNT